MRREREGGDLEPCVAEFRHAAADAVVLPASNVSLQMAYFMEWSTRDRGRDRTGLSA